MDEETIEGTIEGTFIPPSVGVGGRTIPMAGTGTLELTPDALVAKGFEGRGGALVRFLDKLPSALVAWFTILTIASVTVVGTLLLFHYINLPGGGTRQLVPMAIGVGLLAAVTMPRKASTAPFELVIPWSSIDRVALNPLNVQTLKSKKDLLIHVNGSFKPKGILHFKPANEAQVAAIQMQIVAAMKESTDG